MLPLKIQRPLSFQWIILISLIFFSFFPIFILQLIQVATLPQNVERDQIERSERELNFAATLIQQLIAFDKNNLAFLADNENIRDYIINPSNQTLRSITRNVILNFMNLSESNSESSSSNQFVLEVGLDLIENYTLSSSDYSFDQLSRLISINYNNETQTFITLPAREIQIPMRYYPYAQIKNNFPTKVEFSSSIRQRTNFLTGEAILDNKDSPIPVIINSRLISGENGRFIGLLYTVNHASPILDVIDALNNANRPAFLTNKAGSVFYDGMSLFFTEVTGYYKTILNSTFDETTIDPDGYDGEITIFRHLAIDIVSDQTILIAIVLPRHVIFHIFQDAIFQALLTIIASITLASILAFLTTKWLTNRMRQVSEAVEQVSKGNFAVKLDTNGTDELARLNRSFIQMTKSLKSMAEKDKDLE